MHKKNIDWLKKPEYTGENRCTPCTVVNIAIAAIVGLALFFVWPPVAPVIFFVSIVIIYVRGYLIPGTPTYTKRYAPAWFLAVFDKHPAVTNDTKSEDGPVDEAQRVLLNHGLLKPTQDGSDLKLSESFQEVWHDRIANFNDEADLQKRWATIIFEAGTDEVAITSADSGMVSLSQNGRRQIAWPSWAAYLADVAAASLVAERYNGWSNANPEMRRTLVTVLRLFLETCPLCSGSVEAAESVRESCCSSYDVFVIECVDCEAKIQEQPVNEE